MKNKVLIYGSIALDSIETPVGSREEILGGSASYACLSASFFVPSQAVSVIGKDFPPEHTRLLEEHNVDLHLVEVKEGKTFRWKGRYGQNPNQRETIFTQQNVLENYLPHLSPEGQEARYVFLANNSPSSQKFLLEQVKKPSLVAWDTMNLWIDNFPEAIIDILPGVDIALFNDSEIQEFTKNTNLLEAGKQILSSGVKKGVVIKKGEHGALLLTPSFTFSVPAFPVERVIDPTGAGDSFAGGLVGFLTKEDKVNEETLKKATVYGSIIASFAVEGFGVERIAELSKTEIDERYQQLKEMTQF